MTAPSPLTQQRKFVRDFLAATQQRSTGERTAQQQYAASEKSANEQRVTSERVAQQQYATDEKAAEQQHAAAVKQQNDEQSRQQRQLEGAVTAIGEAWNKSVADLRTLGVSECDLSPSLEDASSQAPTAGASAAPLPQFLSAAEQIEKLKRWEGRRPDTYRRGLRPVRVQLDARIGAGPQK